MKKYFFISKAFVDLHSTTKQKDKMKAQIRKEFKEWMNDGNVIFYNGTFRTQDAQWKNRIADMKALMTYYIKEFCI